MTFPEWTQHQWIRCEQQLERYLPKVGIQPAYLMQAMHYAVLGGGKRVRPLLVYAVQDFCQRLQLPTLPQEEAFDRCAVALEYIHVYSLVHDDMPCMDDDDLRRGKPTVHVEYDEPTALLVGDALQSLAFEVLSHCPTPAEQVVPLLQYLSSACGYSGMVGGQAIDLESVETSLTQSELEVMHSKKTGALLKAAVLLPAILAQLPHTTLQALDTYAQAVGLAFQVMDDVLDVTSTTAMLGKTAGKDAKNNKPTYVSLLGVEKARAYARALHQQALHALELLDKEHAIRLEQIATFIIEREQ